MLHFPLDGGNQALHAERPEVWETANMYSHRHQPLLFGAALAALLFAAPGGANAQFKITGPSPFSGCTADDVSNQPGTYYPNAEVEPWVDVNPANLFNVIAGWQQDRWSNGGARGLVSAYSKNGGFTWKRVVVGGITKCSGGTYDRASDPWVTIAADGTAYFMSLVFMNDEPSGAFGDNAMLVSRSSNGGASWGPPKVLRADTDGKVLNDKNSMTADPKVANNVYAVWDRLVDYTLPSAAAGPLPAALSMTSRTDSVVNARDRYRKFRKSGAAKRQAVPLIFEGPTYFTRTTNGGASWEPARVIYDSGPNAQTINNLTVIRPNGDVLVFFTDLPADGSVKIGFVKSADKGATFGPVTHALEMNLTLTGTLTPDAVAPVRDANILYDVAVDRRNGNLYLVWQDARFNGVDQVAFSMSADGGSSWSTPVRIARTPANANALRTQSFVPSIEVGRNGMLVVTYYDFRRDISNGKEATDYWSISCNIRAGADCTRSAGWGNEFRLTANSFNMLDAPIARGHFLGDYMGLVRQGPVVRPVFGIAVAPNKTDVVTRIIP